MKERRVTSSAVGSSDSRNAFRVLVIDRDNVDVNDDEGEIVAKSILSKIKRLSWNDMVEAFVEWGAADVWSTTTTTTTTTTMTNNTKKNCYDSKSSSNITRVVATSASSSRKQKVARIACNDYEVDGDSGGHSSSTSNSSGGSTIDIDCISTDVDTITNSCHGDCHQQQLPRTLPVRTRSSDSIFMGNNIRTNRSINNNQTNSSNTFHNNSNHNNNVIIINNNSNKNHRSRTSLLLLLAGMTCIFNIWMALKSTKTTTITSNIDSSSKNEYEISLISRNNGAMYSSEDNTDGLSTSRRDLEVTVLSTPTRRPVRVLAGIFTTIEVKDQSYRKVFRELFSLHYPRVCTLHDYQLAVSTAASIADAANQYQQSLEQPQAMNILEHCHFLYTFVLGGNNSDTAPTEIVQYDEQHPILANYMSLQDSNTNNTSNDWNEHDMTFLNIRENMNDGKSQTWLYYASTVASELSMISTETAHRTGDPSYDVDEGGDIIDYIFKIDTDTVLFMDRFFSFAKKSLVPYPFNYRTLGGTIVDKVWWNMKPLHKRKTELFYYQNFQTMHLYAAGQLYFVSTDLARDIASVAAQKYGNVANVFTNETFPLSTVVERIEDHDISAMAQLAATSDRPIKYLIIPVGNPFWKHNIKIRFGKYNEWAKVWSDEIERIKSIPNYIARLSSIRFVSTSQKPSNISVIADINNNSTDLRGNLRGSQTDADIDIDFNSTNMTATTNEISLKDEIVNMLSTQRMMSDDLDEEDTKSESKNVSSINSPSDNQSVFISVVSSALRPWEQFTGSILSGLKKTVASLSTTLLSSSNTKSEVISTTSNATPAMDSTDNNTTIGQTVSPESDHTTQLMPVLTMDNDEKLLDYIKRAYPSIFTVGSIQSSSSLILDSDMLYHVKDYVEITNAIADPRECFIVSEKGGYLEHPMKIVEFNAEGAQYPSEIGHVIQSSKGTQAGSSGLKNPDVLLLNEMDYNVTIVIPAIETATGLSVSTSSTNDNIQSIIVHSVEQVAKTLQMNYAWAIESVTVSRTIVHSAADVQVVITTDSAKDNSKQSMVLVVTKLSFRGNAVLSKCPLYEPKIVRDVVDSVQTHTTSDISSDSANDVISKNWDNVTPLLANFTPASMDHKTDTHYYYFGKGPIPTYEPSGLGLFARTGHLNRDENDSDDRNNHNENNSGDDLTMSGETAITTSSTVNKQTTTKIVGPRHNNVVTGSVHKLYNTTNARVLGWQYMFQREAPPQPQQILSNGTVITPHSNRLGIPPKDQIGAVVAGDMSHSICSSIGLHNFDKYHKLKTFPVDCAAGTVGRRSSASVCANIPLYKRFREMSYMPCHYSTNTDADSNSQSQEKSTSTKQLSRHGLVAMMFM